MWETSVANAVQGSLHAFHSGDVAAADHLVGEVGELEIFKKPVSKAPVARWLWWLALYDLTETLLIFTVVAVLI